MSHWLLDESARLIELELTTRLLAAASAQLVNNGERRSTTPRLKPVVSMPE